jgi:hypothetical protein
VTIILLSWVYGCVTNNNGFWIGWLDLLTASSTISRNHNQLQELTINLQPNPSSLTAEDSLHSRFRSTTVLRSVPSYNSTARTPRRTCVTCQECVFTGLLPSNGCPSFVESVISGMCLPSRCLAVVICITIPNAVQTVTCARGRILSN